jgi:hypothetical protein
MRRFIDSDVMPEETSDIEAIIFSTPRSEWDHELDQIHGHNDD